MANTMVRWAWEMYPTLTGTLSEPEMRQLTHTQPRVFVNHTCLEKQTVVQRTESAKATERPHPSGPNQCLELARPLIATSDPHARLLCPYMRLKRRRMMSGCSFSSNRYTPARMSRTR